MALEREWERIARELGDHDLEPVGSPYLSDEMVRVEDDFYVGDWVPSQEACTEIARLRAENAQLRGLLDRTVPFIGDANILLADVRVALKPTSGQGGA